MLSSYIVTRGEFSSRELSDSTLYSHPVASFLASFCLVGASWAATVACLSVLSAAGASLELFLLLVPLKPVTSWRQLAAGSFHSATRPSSPARRQVRRRHLVRGAPRPWRPAAPRERSDCVPGWLRPERARSLCSPPRLLALAAAPDGARRLALVLRPTSAGPSGASTGPAPASHSGRRARGFVRPAPSPQRRRWALARGAWPWPGSPPQPEQPPPPQSVSQSVPSNGGRR